MQGDRVQNQQYHILMLVSKLAMQGDFDGLKDDYKREDESQNLKTSCIYGYILGQLRQKE